MDFFIIIIQLNPVLNLTFMIQSSRLHMFNHTV